MWHKYFLFLYRYSSQKINNYARLNSRIFWIEIESWSFKMISIIGFNFQFFNSIFHVYLLHPCPRGLQRFTSLFIWPHIWTGKDEFLTGARYCFDSIFIQSSKSCKKFKFSLTEVITLIAALKLEISNYIVNPLLSFQMAKESIAFVNYYYK